MLFIMSKYSWSLKRKVDHSFVAPGAQLGGLPKHLSTHGNDFRCCYLEFSPSQALSGNFAMHRHLASLSGLQVQRESSPEMALSPSSSSAALGDHIGMVTHNIFINRMLFYDWRTLKIWRCWTRCGLHTRPRPRSTWWTTFSPAPPLDPKTDTTFSTSPTHCRCVYITSYTPFRLASFSMLSLDHHDSLETFLLLELFGVIWSSFWKITLCRMMILFNM